MDKVKELMAAGVPIAQAIKFALAEPVSAWAGKHRIPRSTAINTINGIQRPTDQVVAALVAELGGTEEEWRELLWLAMKPAHLVAS
jgi:hypothetical protein